MGYRTVGVFSKKYIPTYPPLSVELNVDKLWDDAQVELIKSATQLMIDRIDEGSIRECAKASTTRGFPGESGVDSIDTDFRDVLYSWLMVPCFDCDLNLNSRRLVIERVDLGTDLGKAQLSGHIPNDPRGDLYLKVQLNFRLLNNPVETGFGRGDSPEVWANTITHEMLHNFQYAHGSGNDYDANYRGFFVEEFGNCVGK